MIDPEEFIERGRKAQEAVNQLGAGKPRPAVDPELAAMLTATRAELGDFRREYDQWTSEADVPAPDFASWAHRFAHRLTGFVRLLGGAS